MLPFPFSDRRQFFRIAGVTLAASASELLRGQPVCTGTDVPAHSGLGALSLVAGRRDAS